MEKAVAGIVLYKDKVLIGKKIVKEGHFVSGGWHIPGGHILVNESEEEALIREFKEETSLDIKISEKITRCNIPRVETVVNWYLCETESDNYIPGDDLEEVKFVPKDKVLEECDSRAVELWPEEVIKFFLS